MSHTLSTQPTTGPWSSRIPARAVTAGGFALHFAEMWIAMLAGMMVYMAVPTVMALPALQHQVGMGISMTVPMVVWMRLRGHGWRHGMEMAGGMLVPWAAVLGLVALGAANVLPWLAKSADIAMLLGMLGVMLVRRDHFTHSGAHQHGMSHSETRQTRRVPWSRVFLATAYLSAILLVP